MPVGVVNGLFYHIFSYSTTFCSCFINSLLIYAIIVTRVGSVGPYRYMLLSFAIVDFCISLTHAAILPVAHMTDFGILCLPYGTLHLPTAFGFWSMLWWVFLLYQTFILLAFHYVYRYVLLCKPLWTSWIQRKPWRNWISIAVCTELVYSGTIVYVCYSMEPTEKTRHAFASLVMEEYKVDIFDDNAPGFLAFTPWIPLGNGEYEWQTSHLRAVSFTSALVCATIIVILYCIRQIRRNAVNEKHLESKTRLMQQQLLRALLWQTIVPVFTSYVPIGFMAIIPIASGVQMGGMCTVALGTMQLFPMIDPCLILFFIPRYRASLSRLARSVGPVRVSAVKSTESLQNAKKTTAPVVLS